MEIEMSKRERKHFQRCGVISKEANEDGTYDLTPYGRAMTFLQSLNTCAISLERQGCPPSKKTLNDFREMLCKALEEIQSEMDRRSQENMEASDSGGANSLSGKLGQDINAIIRDLKF